MCFMETCAVVNQLLNLFYMQFITYLYFEFDKETEHAQEP